MYTDDVIDPVDDSDNNLADGPCLAVWLLARIGYLRSIGDEGP